MTKQSLDSLSIAIMNIPCKREDWEFRNNFERHMYKEGHRDARHAAVELLLNFIAQNDFVSNPMDPQYPPRKIASRKTEQGE